MHRITFSAANARLSPVSFASSSHAYPEEGLVGFGKLDS